MKVIMMADIVGSSKKRGKALMHDFKEAVDSINKEHKRNILSPLTITLGDEFQGVVKNMYEALKIMFALEHHLMSIKSPFQLRYVLHEGEIDTVVNRVNSYAMLGPGLTQARKQLTELKGSKKRFFISTTNKAISEKLTYGALVYQGIVDRWTPAQRKVAVHLLSEADYREVAKTLKKDPTAIWRRRRSLMIDECNYIKRLILLIVNPTAKWS
ncbi:MAG: SatD family protein [Cyclobacteriaceae bacterium]|nr:SatD family protein [Cyclobacteriaceae bacterium]